MDRDRVLMKVAYLLYQYVDTHESDKYVESVALSLDYAKKWAKDWTEYCERRTFKEITLIDDEIYGWISKDRSQLCE
jgi:hypothetical protein